MGRGKPKYQIKIAKERIKILFEKAEEDFEKHPERSHRYVEIARKIAMKFNLSIPRKYRRRFCKNCYKYLMPGKNATVRFDSEHSKKIIKCEECGEIMRFPYKAE